MEHLSINPNKPLYVSSDIIRLSLLAKRNGDEFSPELLVDTILDYMNLDKATIMFPAYNLTAFTSKHYYDYVNTKGTVGVLGNVALKHEGFIRTWNPMHSIAVIGKDADYLASMRNINSFGEDGPFRYMRDNEVYHLMIDTDFTASFTFLHYVETSVGVPYRFNKIFTGIYKDKFGNEESVSVQYPCRYLSLDTVQQFNRMGDVLEKKGVSRREKINGLDFYVVNLQDSFPYIADDLKNHMAINSYDFNIPREKVYSGDFEKKETLISGQ